MFGLLKYLFEQIDFLKIATFLRDRNNKKQAARLHLVYVKSIEIIELYEAILEELSGALKTHVSNNNNHQFWIRACVVSEYLRKQESNIDVMERLLEDLLVEIKVLDHRFEHAYRTLFPGKYTLLFEARWLLGSSRLPLSDEGVDVFPRALDGFIRTIWFDPGESAPGERKENKITRAWNYDEKMIVDINAHDGDKFLGVLEWYFSKNDPYKKLHELRETTESFRLALTQNFALVDVLSDISSVRMHGGWEDRWKSFS